MAVGTVAAVGKLLAEARKHRMAAAPVALLCGWVGCTRSNFRCGVNSFRFR